MKPRYTGFQAVSFLVLQEAEAKIESENKEICRGRSSKREERTGEGGEKF